MTVGLFLMLAGFIIGLGAVAVIDLHGFLGRRSGYWTEATIRTHKVTKPLIWLGMLLTIVGGTLFYKNQPMHWIMQYHLGAAIALIANGCFLSFVISPELLHREKKGKSTSMLPKAMQQKITVSFFVSFVVWWSSVYLFAVFLTLPQITSFEQCAAAGNPVMESYPRQCRTQDGKHFVEQIDIKNNTLP